MLRAVRNILHGPLPEKWAGVADASNLWRKLPFALLLASLLVFGCFPRLLTEKIKPDARKDRGEHGPAPVQFAVDSRQRMQSTLRLVCRNRESRNRQSKIDERFLDQSGNLGDCARPRADAGGFVRAAPSAGGSWPTLAIAALGTLLLTNLGDCRHRHGVQRRVRGRRAGAVLQALLPVAAMLVLFMSVEFADRIAGGIGEYYSLILFALSGMLFAASANDFAMLFVSLELITITFYVLTSFQRGRLVSLEAGVKYLIIGALSSAFIVFGIALVWGTTGKLNFTELAAVAAQFETNKIFLFGLLFVLVGLGFKIAAFPFQIWAPDVYQGAPTPTTAFLAVGSKAAGFVLLLRVLFTAVPDVTAHWANLLIVISGITILYGNLCAIPQRNLKRLLGYSSIAHAGYLLLGVAALSATGQAAVLYYLGGYLFTVLAAFPVICARAAAAGRRGHFGPGRSEPALAVAGRDDDAGDGFAGGHSAAGRVSSENSCC